jgi:hypothetical protein
MEALNSAFDIACSAAKAAMEPTIVAHLGGPLTDKMPAGAPNETDVSTIRATEPTPVVIAGVVLIAGRDRLYGG